MKKLRLSSLCTSTTLGLLASFMLAGCMPDSLTKYQKDPVVVEAASGGGTSSGTVPAVNLSSLTTFQVKNITANNTTYNFHKYGQLGAGLDCEMPVSSLADGETFLTDQTASGDNSSANDLLCWLDAEELQLFHNGFSLQINVPAGYCDYIRVEPYYFWQHQPAYTSKTLKEVKCDDSTAAYCPGTVTLTDADKACYGDHTKEIPAGPNCDSGEVKINSYSWTTPGSVAMTTATTKCGGRRSACYAGPGVDFGVDSYGYPVAKDYWAYSGDTVTYTVTKPGPGGKGYSSNRYVSNFTNMFSNGTYTYNYTTVSGITGMERFSETDAVTDYNYGDLGFTTAGAVKFDVAWTATAVDGVGLDPLKAAWDDINPFYTISCINSAEEVKGRIRIQVREWNQKFTSTTVAGDQVNRSNHSRLKKQSVSSTDYETSGIKYWNDIMDWDTPCRYNGSCSGTTPAGITNADYGFSFPTSAL